MDLNPTFETAGTFVPDNLHAGDHPMMTGESVIAQGQVLGRGAVLGRVNATNRYVLSVAAAVDGSQTPRQVLLHAVDTTDAPAAAPVAKTGEFNARALVFGAGHSASTQATIDALEDAGIFLTNASPV